MKHGIILTVGIAAGALFWLLGLAEGYFADPTPLPFWILYPFFLLAVAAITVSVSIGYCVWLIFVRKTRRNLTLVLAALIGPLVILVGPRLLNGYDAFVYRMKSFSDAEYRSVAADIKTAFDERGIRRLRDLDLHETEKFAILESLVDAHPILAISDFPLDLAVSGERVVLEWGSGLTGGYQIEISLNSEPSSKWAGPSGPGLPGPYQILERTYIYDGVVLEHLP